MEQIDTPTVASDGLGATPRRLEYGDGGPERRVPLDDVIDGVARGEKLSDRDESLARAIAIVTFRRFGTVRTTPGSAPRPGLAEGPSGS